MPNLQVSLEFQWGHHGAYLKRPLYDSTNYLHLGIWQMLEGEMAISATGYTKRLVEPGEVWLTHAGKPSVLRQVGYEQGKRVRVRGADFRGTILSGINLCFALDIPLTLTGEPAQEMISAVLKMRDAVLDHPNSLQGAIKQKAAEGRILEMLLSTSRITPQGRALELAKDRLLPVLDFMRANLHRCLRHAELAKMMNLSQSRFKTLFRESFHQSPMQFHLQMRLAEAARLLRETSNTLDEIAQDTGFNTAFHLSRQFKAKIGKPPSIYRKTWRE